MSYMRESLIASVGSHGKLSCMQSSVPAGVACAHCIIFSGALYAASFCFHFDSSELDNLELLSKAAKNSAEMQYFEFPAERVGGQRSAEDTLSGDVARGAGLPGEGSSSCSVAAGAGRAPDAAIRGGGLATAAVCSLFAAERSSCAYHTLRPTIFITTFFKRLMSCLHCYITSQSQRTACSDLGNNHDI